MFDGEPDAQKGLRSIQKRSELTPLGQKILQILAVLDFSVQFRDLQLLLERCQWGVVEQASGSPSPDELRECLRALHKRNLLWASNGMCNHAEINAEVRDALLQDSVLNGSFGSIVEAMTVHKERFENGWSTYSYEYDQLRGQYSREARIAFYRGDVAQFKAALARLASRSSEATHLGLLEPFNQEIFDRAPAELQEVVVAEKLHQAVTRGIGSVPSIEACRKFAESQSPLPRSIANEWIMMLMLSGDLNGLRKVADSEASDALAASSCIAFLTGDFETAEAQFKVLGRQMAKATGKRSHILPDLFGVMYALLLLRKKDSGSRKSLRVVAEAAPKWWSDGWENLPLLFGSAAEFDDSPTTQNTEEFEADFRRFDKTTARPARLFAVYLNYWFMRSVLLTKLPHSMAVSYFEQLGMHWLAALCEDTATMFVRDGQNQVQAGHRHGQLGTFPMLNWIEPEAVWKKKLESMRLVISNRSGQGGGKGGDSKQDERLIWELEYYEADDGNVIEILPVIQKLSRGKWSDGRSVSLEQLYKQHSSPKFAFLTDQDRDICKCIEVEMGYFHHRGSAHVLNTDAALKALVGHPLVFLEGSRAQTVDVFFQKPELVIRRVKSGLQLELVPHPPEGTEVAVVPDGEQRLGVVVFTKEQLKVAAVLEHVLEIPKSGERDLLAAMKDLSSLFSVQSDIKFSEQDGEANVKSIASDSRPHLHLLPFQEGLRVEFLVYPFGDAGPIFSPGQGGENIFTEIDREPVTTHRNLKEEKKLAREIVETCSLLANSSDGRFSPVELPLADDALEFLLQIEPARESGKLVVHWPQGQSLRSAGTLTEKQLRVRIDRDKDWFEASGDVVIDESLQMDLMKLMELISTTPGRFVQISDGRFLALTEQLRNRIAAFAAFSERRSDKLRFPQIRAAALSDLDEWCSVKSDKHWKACLKRISDAGDVVAEVPSTLNAELRDYQIEGFRWLCRLAHWGAGACLADDMGLGKTLQAIAMLLRRAADGPSLVIAPTSVCFNWEAELRRFAPTLNPRVFGQGNRDAILAELGPRDVVIVSYGLLNTEVERLQAVHWTTAILDEAQAIKNTLTKRSQAAMSLNADFRLILTGTPIENHLGELWNLFQFINPGLLGSLEQFHQRFALPIERDHNREVSQQLKRLVQPFLLRRTKTQVLSELPPRTEVTVSVTLSDEEALIYEAARQRAVQELAEKTDDARGQHVRILAEIMRLRRACCHPSLLMPDCSLPGAKLTAFSETIDELIENRHKALVFSQFVDHLSILRAELDRKRIAYQYLDGSTSMNDRKKAVDAFQNGEGDVFLISLKAGGSGLNLTAADYVLHMDPWWNPAVEDQAADRAHRMGQQRPVTIYRFITRGTIEEKILALHTTKRDLADSLLEGSDTTGRLSAEELLALIR